MQREGSRRGSFLRDYQWYFWVAGSRVPPFSSRYFSVSPRVLLLQAITVCARRQKSGAAREDGGRPGAGGLCVALTAPRVSLEQGRTRRWCR